MTSDALDMGSFEVKTRIMDIGQLMAAPYNPRFISDESFNNLSNSIDYFGMISLIVWNEASGHVVGGHQRLKVLQEAGETQTEVIVVSLPDEEEVMLNIALNNPKTRADFTKEIVSLLAVSEAQIGSAFNRIGLGSLAKSLDNFRFEIEEERPKKEKKKKEPKKKSETFLSEEVPADQSNEPEAIIKCPSCEALWRMRDNKIVYSGNGGKI